MANIGIIDATGITVTTKASGTGTPADPLIPAFQLIDPATKVSLALDYMETGKPMMPIHIEHPHWLFFNVHLEKQLDTPVTALLTAEATKGTRILTVADSSSFGSGNLRVETSTTCEGNSIKIIGQSAGDITIARELDNTYPIGTEISIVELNMNKNGATTPVSFRFNPHPCFITHVETINWYIKTPTESFDSTLGGGPAVARGLHMRTSKDSGTELRTIGVFRDNQRFRVYDYELLYGSRASPADDYWTWAKIHLRNQNDGIMRLDSTQGDFLEVLVQDDLTSASNYTEIECVVGGHFEI